MAENILTPVIPCPIVELKRATLFASEFKCVKKMSEVEEALRQSVTLLIDLQSCLNNVGSRLESKKDVPHVERFPEKNLLTHDCIGEFVFFSS